MNQYQFV